MSVDIYFADALRALFITIHFNIIRMQRLYYYNNMSYQHVKYEDGADASRVISFFKNPPNRLTLYTVGTAAVLSAM